MVVGPPLVPLLDSADKDGVCVSTADLVYPKWSKENHIGEGPGHYDWTLNYLLNFSDNKTVTLLKVECNIFVLKIILFFIYSKSLICTYTYYLVYIKSTHCSLNI